MTQAQVPTLTDVLAQMREMQAQMQALANENATLKAQAATPTRKGFVMSLRYVAAGEINKRFAVAIPRIVAEIRREGESTGGYELSAPVEAWRTLLADVNELESFVTKHA